MDEDRYWVAVVGQGQHWFDGPYDDASVASIMADNFRLDGYRASVIGEPS